MLLITGASGQLATALAQQIPSGQAIFRTSKQLDITDARAVERAADAIQLSGILNCAAYTAVDLAEDSRDAAVAANHTALITLGKLARQHAVPILHLSTDYVFDGTGHRPYIESDPTAPVNFYGETKLAGERALLAEAPLCAVIRTSWVYSSQGRNFVQTMLNLATTRPELNVIFDQIGSPTYAVDLASVMLKIFSSLTPEMPKVYHYSNEGVASWYDFAKAIFEIKGLPTKVHPILSSQYPTRAKRPHYSVMDKSLIKSTFGIEIPHWRESLIKCLNLS